MVEDCSNSDTENLGGETYKGFDELYKIANSLFRELFGVELGFKELQCLTQQELYSFVQSSENLKKLCNAKIIDIINCSDNKDKVKHNLRMDMEYIKPLVEKYGTNDEVFDTILYVKNLLRQSSLRIEIRDLLELMDFFSGHMIDKVKFDILKKLSKECDFTRMNIIYKVMAVENYLTGKNGDISLDVNYKEIERESVLLECREKGGWIDTYGRVIPLYYCGAHDYNAKIIIGDDKCLSRKFGEYKGRDYREFLVQECGWVKFTGENFFKSIELGRNNPYFSFQTDSITKRPHVTKEQLNAIIDIWGIIPKDLV